VTVVAPPSDPPPPPGAGGVWRPAVGMVACGGVHPVVRGRLDERARRLPHEEYAVARRLAAEGHTVRSVPEQRHQSRTADLMVCDIPVEVKSWLSLAERGGVAPGARSVVNKLLQAEGQAPTVVLNGRGTGLTAASARAGMAEYASLERPGQVTAVRVLGNGFDLGWVRDQSLSRHQVLHRSPVRQPTRLEAGRPDLGVSL